MNAWYININNLNERQVIAHYLENDFIDEKYYFKYDDIRVHMIYDVDECYLGMTGNPKIKN